MKKIALFTGTRAEYGLMRNLIHNLIEDNKFDFNLLVSGSHLNEKFGLTIKEIESDGIKTKYKLPILYGGSVNNKNISNLKNIIGIKGFLVGSASQNSKKFIDIIKKTIN